MKYQGAKVKQVIEQSPFYPKRTTQMKNSIPIISLSIRFFVIPNHFAVISY